MSTLEKRLQVLLDQAQYDRVKQAAERTGCSVGAVVRDAIDAYIPADDESARAAAASRLLDRHAVPETGPTEDWTDFKRSYDEAMERSTT